MNIIINRMYAGGYLNLSENMIGHEAINLVETDPDENGKNHRFVWLNANGKCSNKNLAENDNIVLLVRNVDEPGVVQVIARAEVKGNKVITGMDSSDRYLRESQQPRELMYYGGKNVYDIYASNRIGHKGEEDTYATFEVKDFRIPKGEMFLTDADAKNLQRDNIYSICTDTEKAKHFAKSSLRQFIEYNGTPKYMADNLWLKYDDIPSVDERKKLFGAVDCDNKISATSEQSIIDIIGDTYHELSYSNFLAHFLNRKDILKLFASAVLDITDLDVENCIITREEYNIDILIQSKKYVIVIENKIKSGITEGTSGTTIKKQIEKMFKEENDANEFEKKFLNDHGECVLHKGTTEYKLNETLEETEGVSQLSKYYLYALKIAKGRKIKCFVLAPDYHIESLALDKYFCSGEYDKLHYSNVKDFFEKYNNNNPNSVRFIKDYIDALAPHSKKFDNYLEDKLLQGFISTINKGKTDKKHIALHKQLSLPTFKNTGPTGDDKLLAKYVMILRVKYLEFNGDDKDTVAFFALTDEEIKERIILAGLKYLKNTKKENPAHLSSSALHLICAYGNFKMKYKKVKEIEDLCGIDNCMSKEDIMKKCYEIGKSKECKSQLYDEFKDSISCKKKEFFDKINLCKPENSIEEKLKKMIENKIETEIVAADKIFTQIQGQ